MRYWRHVLSCRYGKGWDCGMTKGISQLGEILEINPVDSSKCIA